MSQAPPQTEAALDHSVEDLLKQVEQGAKEIAETLASEQGAPAATPSAASPNQPAASDPAAKLDEGVAAAIADAKAAAAPAPASAPLPTEPVALDAALAAKAAAAVDDEFDDPAAMTSAAAPPPPAAPPAPPKAAVAATPTTGSVIAGEDDSPPPDAPTEGAASANVAEKSAAEGAPKGTATAVPQTAAAGDSAVSTPPSGPSVQAAPGLHPVQLMVFRLATLPATMRQTIGWVALGTHFWAGVVWVWALFLLGPAPAHGPEPAGAPTLVGAPSDGHAPAPKHSAPKPAPAAAAEHGGGHH